MTLARGLAIALSLTLGGCSFNPFTTDNHLTGSPGGAAVGAAAGAGTMALLGADKPLIFLAGLGGASIGYYVTSLYYASGGINKVGGQVYTVGDYAAIVIPSDEIFDSNSADLLPSASPVLQSTLAVLSRYPDRNILISASSSGFGTRKFQLQLTEKRAKEVAAYLWANGINNFKNPGISTRTLMYVGYGNYFPIANDLHNASNRQNSRIQITAYPCKADLHLDSRHKVFANIGAMDDNLNGSSS